MSFKKFSYILIADDDRTIRDLLRRFLQERGYHVESWRYAVKRVAAAVLASSFLLLCAPASTAGRSQASPVPPGKGHRLGRALTYVDTHTHLFPRRNPGFDFEQAALVALAKMNELDIRKSLIMPPPFAPDDQNIYTIDDFLDTIDAHPDELGFLGGGGTLNVMIHEAVRGGNVGARIRDSFEDEALDILSKGAVGFGEMAALHLSFRPGHPYLAVSPDHPLFLQLADIAAQYDVPIDIHMEAVSKEMDLPERFESPPNPKKLDENIDAFERLLDHNPEAKIVWTHAGWDNTGHRTVKLMRRLLRKHENLYMNIKIFGDGVPGTNPVHEETGELRPGWLELIKKYRKRFLVGSDHFHVPSGANIRFPESVEPTIDFLGLLPRSLARMIGSKNPDRIYAGPNLVPLVHR